MRDEIPVRAVGHWRRRDVLQGRTGRPAIGSRGSAERAIAEQEAARSPPNGAETSFLRARGGLPPGQRLAACLLLRLVGRRFANAQEHTVVD